jgi:hypothetical protein
MDPKKLFLGVAGGILGAAVGFAAMGAKGRKAQCVIIPTLVGAGAGAATLVIGDAMMEKKGAAA